MRTLQIKSPKGLGSLKISASPLGKGGEGEVFTVVEHDCPFLPGASELVVKLYFEPLENNRPKKVSSMVQCPPQSDSVAWPLALVGENGAFQGYVMRKLDSKNQKEWLYFANTKDRRNNAPDFSMRYALNSCLNLAIAMNSIHEAGHMQGDCNESNVFVSSSSSVTIVDTDSAQIRASNGEIYRCTVGKPEFTAPELVGHNLKDVDRTVETEAFAFAIMLFQMLTGGAHPTDGVYKGSDNPPSIPSKISAGIYPALRNEAARGFSETPRVAARAIPQILQELLLRLLSVEPSARPSFEIIITTLKDAMANLQQCTVEENHWFDKRDGSCTWCANAAMGNFDPWAKGDIKASASFEQEHLPDIDFTHGSNGPARAPRAPLQNASGQNGHGQTPLARQPNGSMRFPTNYGSPTSYNQPQGGVPQVTPSYSNYSSQHNQPPPQTTVAKNIPAKIKGKMTVVYPNGNYGPRPPMGVLFISNRKLWRQAIAAEWPEALKFWWPKNRANPHMTGFIVGAVLALAMQFAIYTFLTGAIMSIETSWLRQLAAVFYLGGGLITGVATIWLFVSTLIALLRSNKRSARVGPEPEGFIRTMIRPPLVGSLYMLVLPLVILSLLSSLIISRAQLDRR